MPSAHDDRPSASAPAEAERPYGERHRRLVYAAAFLSIAWHGGVVYGWPNMRSILRRDGVLLGPTCAANNGSSAADLCPEQELDFGVIYTLGAWSNQAARLLIGAILDRFGPRITGVTSALFFACGAAIFAFATSSAGGLAVGFFLIGGGGAGIQLSVQSVAALFPRHRSTAMASLSGAYQLASIIYLLFEVMHRQGVAVQGMLLFESGVAACTALCLLLILPDLPFGLARRRTSRGAGCQPPPQSAAVPAPPQPASSGGGGEDEPAASKHAVCNIPLRERSFREQALSAESLLLLAYFSVCALQCQFTVASIGAQLERMGDADGAMIRYFGTCLALACLWTPLLGNLTDRVGFLTTLTLTNSLLLVATACLLVPSLELTYLSAIVYAVGRVSLWALYFSYTAHVFGFRHFGKLVGCGLTLAACFSLLQYPLLYLCIRVLDGDFTVANAIFLALHGLAYGTLGRLGRGAREAALPIIPARTAEAATEDPEVKIERASA